MMQCNDDDDDNNNNNNKWMIPPSAEARFKLTRALQRQRLSPRGSYIYNFIVSLLFHQLQELLLLFGGHLSNVLFVSIEQGLGVKKVCRSA